ncbi:hypothetical protein HS048_22665 [Planomonospora sp. ID91781]|uniref:hypothetical protein n=1 Tax=Planomonospora sp. ID91781 TaxID=2738135 RepID=UPI0018C3A686|nr:hypothetical protein [Planomonospora sp. ID91781]MBG0823534.1 hypothetical protein [Planomonospora sp. ID91781]
MAGPGNDQPDVRARIDECRRSGSTVLDLSGMDLEALPESFDDFTGLIRLDVTGNRRHRVE